MKFILGEKLGMTHIYDQQGNQIPVTMVKAGPCQVVAVKNKQTDGYSAVQVGWRPVKKLNKPQQGHLKGLPQFGVLKEFRLEAVDRFKKGTEIKVSIFRQGDKVKVSGISKGKGFQGVVKRHGFAGSPASHGHKDQLRMPGSIGATGPARVFKGTKMPGRMGGKRITVNGLEVVKVEADKDLIYIKGAVPGNRGALLEITAPGYLKLAPVKKVKPESKEAKAGQPSEKSSSEKAPTAEQQDKQREAAEKKTKAENS